MPLPRPRKRFRSNPDELNYLNDLVSHLTSVNETKTAKCGLHLERMKALLIARGIEDGSIMLQDHWATYLEATGEYYRAARHRERELALIDRLFKSGLPPDTLGGDFIVRVFQMLTLDYIKCGKPKKAIALLQKSWRI